MGPMGCGKTTIGEKLSRETGWNFFDADDYHPEANKEKMSQGIPLDDNDRLPWLESLRTIIDDHISKGEDMILACSALKRKYRLQLGIDQKVVFSVYLKGTLALLRQRIYARSHEYMSDDLLQSQLDTLEEPVAGLIVDIAASPEQICRTIEQNIINT